MAIKRRRSKWQKQKRRLPRKRINHQIDAQKVRLVGPNREALGIMPIKNALAKAEEFGLDLVEIVPKANPPVCKIIDYKKFLFDESKKEKEAKKRQKSSQLKEVKFRPRTDEHDYNFKLKNIKNFLEKDNKVKITIQFRGREMTHKELGYKLIERLRNDLEELSIFENNPKLQGRFLITFITAKKRNN